MPTSRVTPANDSFCDPFDPACGDFYGNIGDGGCWDPWDYTCGGFGPPIIIINPPPINIPEPGPPGISPADLATAINQAEAYTTSLVDVVKNLGIALGKAIAGVLSTIGLLWGVLRPVLQAIKDVLAKIKRVLDKILRPILDAQRRQIKAILDIYNRFIRPWIVFIEQVRRLIHILQIFHIHILDGLDRQLAKIEGKLLRPIYALLYRANTLGNWIVFILNARLLIFRGLFLGSLQANQFGAFNLLAGTPLLARSATTGTPAQPPDPPVSVDSLITMLAAGFDDVLSQVDPDTADLLRCFRDSFKSVSIDGGDPVGDLLVCLKSSVGE